MHGGSDDFSCGPGRSSRHGQSCVLTRSPRACWPRLPGAREKRAREAGRGGGAWRTVYAHPALDRVCKCVAPALAIFIIVRELPELL